MSNTGLRVGRHYSPGGKLILETLAQVLDEPASAVQLFAGNPHRYWGSKTDDDKRDKFVHASRHLYKVVHANYLTNICEDPQNRGHRMSINSIVNLLQWAERHGCDSMVFHPGSPKDFPRDDALQWAFEALMEVMSRYEGPVQLLLENAAHPKKLGGDIPELADLVRRVQYEAHAETSRIAICVDTTHAFAAGYDVEYMTGPATPADAPSMDFDLGGLLQLLHFNTPDPEVTIGSKLDRHSNDFDGGAFTKSQLQAIFAKWRQLPIILEGTPDLAHDLCYLLKWETELRETGTLTPPSTAEDLGDIFALADQGSD